MTFRDLEKRRLVALREEVFYDPGNGVFLGKERDFVLKSPMLNLWEGIRKDAVYYFAEHRIQWWKGEEAGPTGHLLSSQVACINHLYPLRQRQDLATRLLQGLDPSVESAVMVDSGYVEFEFIGERQHLKERGFTRGANCTSIDAVMIGRLKSGANCMFLIEWKYTESYTNTDMYIPERGRVYDELIKHEASPFKYKDTRAYYYEPFYQLMRQTLLGWQLTEHSDHTCTEFRHVHVVPELNKDLLQNVTSPYMRDRGATISDVWRSVLAAPERFISTTPEQLLSPVSGGADSAAFLGYLRRRYWSPRRNRVTPFGEFIATEVRGALMGNRGILHDETGELGSRRWDHKTWVTCALDYKGRIAPINAPGRYTQLFFVDEATALAAGHRPCGECRRSEFTRFKTAWLKGNPEHRFADNIKVDLIDAVIHAERVIEQGKKPRMRLAELPDGVMVTLAASHDQAWLLWKGELRRWTPQGYDETLPVSGDELATVLTPTSIVCAIKEGYVPDVSL